jgi:NADH-quinone oxidoreductase subunit F
MEKLLARIDAGNGYTRDLDLLLDLCDQMEGRTVCALADAAAWPVRWGIKRFRDEFEAKCRPSSFAGVSGDGAAFQTDPVIAPGGTP